MEKELKQIKLYLFDLDGTLIETDTLLRETFHTLYKLYKPSDFKIDDKKILTFSGPQITDTLFKEFPEQDQKEMLDAWKKYSTINYAKTTALYPYADELLRFMKKNNIQFGVVTNKHRSATEDVYKLLKLDDLNLISVCAGEAKALKPDPDCIYVAMEKFGIKNKDEVMYIGDSIFDYETAINAGVKFGYVTWSPRKLPCDAKIDFEIDSFKSFLENL